MRHVVSVQNSDTHIDLLQEIRTEADAEIRDPVPPCAPGLADTLVFKRAVALPSPQDKHVHALSPCHALGFWILSGDFLEVLFLYSCDGNWKSLPHILLTRSPTGLWYYLQGQDRPSLTLIGSPNFGYRSVHRDLEAQIAIVTENEELQSQLQEVVFSFSFFLMNYHTPAVSNDDE